MTSPDLDQPLLPLALALLVAVPVDQIKVGPEARFITNLTKERLANAPAFDFAKLR